MHLAALRRIMLLSAIGICGPLWANDSFVSLKVGTWDFDVAVSGSHSKVSGFGNYQIAYGVGFYNNFIASTGLSVLDSEGIGGQLGFGFDISLKYYPITSYGFREIGNASTSIIVTQKVRPYIEVGFHQRQFLLVLASNYVGPGAVAGLDYDLMENWSLAAEYQYYFLNGPSNAEATYSAIILGVTKQF